MARSKFGVSGKRENRKNISHGSDGYGGCSAPEIVILTSEAWVEVSFNANAIAGEGSCPDNQKRAHSTICGDD
jgi:hypothetical protein